MSVKRNFGLNLPKYTTAQLTAIVTQYGPTGTTEVNAIQLGALVRDVTTGEVKVYNGTAFVAGIDYTPA